MKSNHKKVLFISLTLVLITFTETPISAITSAKSSSTNLSSAKTKEKSSPSTNKEENKASQEDEIPTAGQDKLAQLAQAFQAKADDNTYGALWENFVAFIQQQISRQKDPSHLFKSWKALSEAGLKVIDPIGSDNAVHIYVFNRLAQNANPFVPQTKYALIQWNEQMAAAPTITSSEHQLSRRARARKIRTIAVMKTQLINVPGSVDIKEADLLPHICPAKAAAKVSARGVAKNSNKTNKISTPANHYLALSGIDQQSGYTWLSAIKQTSAGWSLYPNLFQDIPTFLVQTNSTKIKFSGNNLIVTMGGTSGYELVMPFTEDHFAFSTKEAQDSAEAVARQFLLAIQYKKLDLAKVWLSDPKLVSIPAYIGLFNRDNDSAPMRIANMSPPICGGSRFRLITGSKDDLIIDVAKIKNQWLIKGLFIASGNAGSGIGAKTAQVH
jgi:hypothetical protein